MIFRLSYFLDFVVVVVCLYLFFFEYWISDVSIIIGSVWQRRKFNGKPLVFTENLRFLSEMV